MYMHSLCARGLSSCPVRHSATPSAWLDGRSVAKNTLRGMFQPNDTLASILVEAEWMHACFDASVRTH
jgi:hypothetical protein